MSRLALIATVDALEVGDTRHAVEILLSLLDGQEEPVEHRVHCPACGQGFAWPALLETHLDNCSTSLRWAE